MDFQPVQKSPSIRAEFVWEIPAHKGELRMRHLNTMLTAAALTIAVASAAYGWGAIAVDDGEGVDQSEVGYGLVTGSATKDAASIDALKACKDEGNEGCVLVLTFPKCGAYAASTGSFGTGTAVTLQAAEQSAVRACGEQSCKVVISDCE
jgi:hypothetical protein